jgi:FkbM family methyltransferase
VNQVQVARNRRLALGLMLRRRLLRWLLAARPAVHAAPFAVLPGDTVSEEVLVAGIYEAALLSALFDGLLASRRSAFLQGAAVDVGANIGNHSLFFAPRFAAVHAFEPNPPALALLRCNAALAGASRLHVHAFGLGDRDAQLPFSHNTDGNLGGSGFGFAGVQGGQVRLCELRRGDGVLPQALQGLPLALLKIDVEGAELAVLQGLADTVARERPVVVFESNRAGGAQGGAQVLAWLRAQAYSDFHVVEDESAGATPLRRLALRLLHGERIRIAPLGDLQDRPYPMLVALP